MNVHQKAWYGNVVISVDYYYFGCRVLAIMYFVGCLYLYLYAEVYTFYNFL